jgi:hypothetical protein
MPIQKTMVEKPTHDIDVPSETIREEEQKDLKEQKDYDNCDDHENEKGELTIVLFTPEQLEVLFKMKRPNFIRLVEALKGTSFQSITFNPIKLGNFNNVQDQKITWRTPKLLERLKCKFESEDNEIRSWGTFLNSQHFRVRGAFWSSKMRTRMNDKWVNYSYGHAQTNQQVN